MNVYTFFEKIDTIKDQLEIIDICKASWIRYNWNFQIINELTAQKHTFYNDYVSIINNLPSANHKKYDYYCFMRWLSMAQIGGGMMIDYDVANLGYYPTDLLCDINITKDKINILEYHIPCVVYGTSDQYLEICKKFCELIDNDKCYSIENNRIHTSDMLMLASGLIIVNPYKYVKHYPNLGKLVHCSYNATKTNKKRIMQEIIYDQK